MRRSLAFLAFVSLVGSAYGQSVSVGSVGIGTAHNIAVPLTCIAASASTTTYTCSTSPTFTPADHDQIIFEADVANTGAATLAINGGAAAPIKKQGGGTALVANDLIIGQEILLIFDGTNWQMQGQTGNVAGITNGAGNNVLPKSNGINLVASSFNDDGTTSATTNATFNISAAGTGNAVLGLKGNTSGTATFTAPAVAGTTSNPILISNQISWPSGAGAITQIQGPSDQNLVINSVSGKGTVLSQNGTSAITITNNGANIAVGATNFSSSFLMQWNSDTGISRDAAGITDFGTSAAGSTAGSAKMTSLIEVESAAPAGVASSGRVWADSTTHEFGAETNGSSSAGMLVRAQPGQIHSTANTAAITTATLCAASAGACNVAGQYHITFTFVETGTACGTPATGGVTFLLTWTDSDGNAHSAVSLGMDDASAINAVSQTFHFQTAKTAAWASGDFNISTNGTIIQYATGYTACGVGTGQYTLDITVTRLQ